MFGAQVSLQQDCGHTLPNRTRHPYSPSTINLRLAAIRRLAYEASDCGLLSPDLAAGIRRVKGVRRLGVRIGNWLTAEEGKKPSQQTKSCFAANYTSSEQQLNFFKLLSPTNLRQGVCDRGNAYFCNSNFGLPPRFSEFSDNGDSRSATAQEPILPSRELFSRSR